MKNLYLFSSVLICAGLISMNYLQENTIQPSQTWDVNKSLAELLQNLGDSLKNPIPQNLNSELVKRGEEIIKFGKTTGPLGKSSKYISKYYNCISCHNTEIEAPNLKVSDPETRLT
ncbi:MAG: hypothetical protein KTR26_21380, partial [Flammeovirgaceae bacterium]|nr:hypothetical protein [Flammeovirgaceae bacterium]